MSAFSTAKRNGLTGANIIHMAQLQQYWTHGFNNPNYMHKAQLVISKSQSQPSHIVLATPTLQDLLNPAPADDVKFPPSASAKELYSTMFDEGDDDKARAGNKQTRAMDNVHRPKILRSHGGPFKTT